MDIKNLLDKANEKLTNVHPIIVSKAIDLVKKCHAEGIYILITHGMRTIAEQNDLYVQGRTKAGNIVTNLRGGYSYHNFGLAFDFAVLDTPSKINWTVDNRWLRVGAIGQSMGLEWGGAWKDFIDYPHFQLTFGLSTTDLRAGKKPPTITINEEEDEMLKQRFEPLEQSKLTSGQRNMLERLVSIGAVAKDYKPSLNTLETMSIIDSAFKNSGFYDFAKKK